MLINIKGDFFMTKIKKSISLLLSFVMIIGLMLCNAVATSAATTATTWDFGSSSGYRKNSSYTQSVEGGSSAEYDGLKVTTTSSAGKFSLSNSNWAQVNVGTQFDIPVEGNSTITIATYASNMAFTYGDDTVSAENNVLTVDYTGDSGYATLVAVDGSYISSITVTPAAEEDVPTAFADEWNFRSGSSLINNGVTLQNTTGTVTQGDAVLKIDATSGKWSTNRTDWAQVNAGTKIEVPVNTGVYTISATTYGENVDMTINGVSTSSGTAKCAYGIVNNTSAKYIPIVYNATDYLGVLKVTAETELAIPVTINGSLGSSKVIFTDTLTGTEYASVSESGNVTLLKGHTYTVSTDNSNISAKIDGSNTFTPTDTTTKTIDVETSANIAVSGTITSENNVLKASNITSLTFVNMDDTSVTGTATVNDDLTYSVELKAGNYNTVAVTNNGNTTSNRVKVGDTAITDEEVYFVKSTSETYYLPTDIQSSSPALTYSSSIKYNNDTCVKANSGTTITVPVSGKQKVTVAGWYSGTWDINGSNSVTAASGSGATNPTTNSYITDGSETTVTVNITADNTYLYWIKVEDYNTISYTSTISVPDDYSTLTEAVSAIKNMTDRPDGEDGRVVINLTADIQEQVLIDTPYVSINGNGHTVSWYYGTTGKYYSVDKNGYYNEELFHDKYELTSASGSLWGGVVIVKGNYFYAENVTFKNTYNYEVTDKEVEDGAVQTLSTGDVTRTKGTDVTAYVYKERANALITDANYIECYKCNILSSQDTLGVNGQRSDTYAYFKECKIGGNVDYICGGGNMVFDDCTLELYGYSDKKNPGYITAAQNTKYLFRNCTVTGNDNGNSTQATAYYGRPWQAGADVKFINTKTNGRVVERGWADWSNGTSAEDATGFGEYCNLNSDGTEFKSSLTSKQLTLEQYNNIVSSVDSEYLGGWIPVHYVPAIIAVSIGDSSISEAICNEKINNGKDLLLYAMINKSSLENADEIGFVLSTVNNLFNKDIYTDENVYQKLVYTDENGETTGMTIADSYAVFAYVINDVADSTDTLYVRTVQKKGDSTIYGICKEINIS